MPAGDQWSNAAGGVEGPVVDAAAVTPSDTTDLAFVTRALYVGVAGDVVVITQKGTTVTLGSLAAGMWHPIRVSRVLATGTTAGAILAGY